jgi:4a-hydroxytetrahydrobiopterin dehydratase
LDPAWQVVEDHHLAREFTFEDFRQALDFVNQVGELAEEEGHHPDVFLSYGKVKIQLWTHKINGLHENDFIMAAKIGALQPAAAIGNLTRENSPVNRKPGATRPQPQSPCRNKDIVARGFPRGTGFLLVENPTCVLFRHPERGSA